MRSTPSVISSNNADTASEIVDSQQLTPSQAFGIRLRSKADELRISRSNLRTWTNTPNQTFGGYWNGERIPPPELLLDLADQLDVSPRWLLSGVDAKPTTAPSLVAVDDADFVGLPRYDLGEITEAGKGHRIDTIPFRRDWLMRRIGTATGLWVIELFASYEELGLYEGDAVICADIPRGTSPPDNSICIFLGDGLFIARYRDRWGSDVADAAGPRIGPADLRDGDVQPIARIRSRLLAGI